MADREVLYKDYSADSRVNVGVHYRSKNLGFTLVQWPHPRGVSPASQTLAGTGGTGWCHRLIRGSNDFTPTGSFASCSGTAGFPELVFVSTSASC
jgi:hypothetical protein